MADDFCPKFRRHSLITSDFDIGITGFDLAKQCFAGSNPSGRTKSLTNDLISDQKVDGFPRRDAFGRILPGVH